MKICRFCEKQFYTTHYKQTVCWNPPCRRVLAAEQYEDVQIKRKQTRYYETYYVTKILSNKKRLLQRRKRSKDYYHRNKDNPIFRDHLNRLQRANYHKRKLSTKF